MLSKARHATDIVRLYKNWPAVFAELASKTPFKPKVYRLRNGIIFHTRAKTNDLGVINSHFILKENNDFLDRLGNKPVIVDIGAHIGVFSIAAAKRYPAAKILSYEPLPENYELLKKNIEANKTRNVSPFNLAIFTKKGTGNLYFNRKFTAGCTLMKSVRNPVSETIKVKSVSVSDIFRTNKIRSIDLLKIDTEGAEYTILKSVHKNYFKKIRFIHSEFHAEKDEKGIKNLLERNGFTTKTVWSTGEYGNLYAENKKFIQ
jgi:FkbM family methyltransferase